MKAAEKGGSARRGGEVEALDGDRAGGGGGRWEQDGHLNPLKLVPLSQTAGMLASMTILPPNYRRRRHQVYYIISKRWRTSNTFSSLCVP